LQGPVVCSSARSTLQEYVELLDAIARVASANPGLCTILDSVTTYWGDSGEDVSTEMQAFCGLTWERCNVLYNLAALEAFQAGQIPLTSQQAAQQVMRHLQNAASMVHYLRSQVSLIAPENPCPPGSALEESFLRVWQHTLLAQAQRTAYDAFLFISQKPKHLILAKLSAAAVVLFQKAQDSSAQSNYADWNDAARAWSMYMTGRSHYHQGMVDGQKHNLPAERARLEEAHKFASFALDFVEDVAHVELMSLKSTVQRQLHEMEERLHQLGSVPQSCEYDELRDIQPQQTVKLLSSDSVRSQLLKSNSTSLIDFWIVQTGLNATSKRYHEQFVSEMDALIQQMTMVAHEKTEKARHALDMVHLPHSLTMANPKALPDDIWDRMQQHRDDHVKQDVWQLRDLADAAQAIRNAIEQQLTDDAHADTLFRAEHAAFEGHDVEQVQASFKSVLHNCNQLLQTAQQTDALLLERYHAVETDPKFKLLKFSKSQLDPLLAQVAAASNSDAYNVDVLSSYLVQLSVLFDDRDKILQAMRLQLQNFACKEQLTRIQQQPTRLHDEQVYRTWLEQSKQSFAGPFEQVKQSIERQNELLRCILQENEEFMRAKETSRSNHNSGGESSCIVKIEDALDEIEQFTKHLKEGRSFYQLMIPKLQSLQQQVDTVSARLTAERMEFEDNMSRSRQEEEDLRMAENLFSDPVGRVNNSSGDPASASSSSPNYSSNNHHSNNSSWYHANDSPQRRQELTSQPGNLQVSHNEIAFRVDDEKVASLVAMDFDPEQVVAALTKYDNNVEQALNELLSG
jgi:hypothetical protein